MVKTSQAQIDKIISLRMMHGKSLKDIVKITGIPKATVSKYCCGLRSNNAPKPTINQRAASYAARKSWNRKRELIKELAISQWPIIKADPTLLSLVAFYWSEGTKRTKGKTGNFVFTNSDPGPIKAVQNALARLGCKTQYSVTVYDGQNLTESCDAWARVLGTAPHHAYSKPMRNSHKLYSKHGVVRLKTENNMRIWHSIMAWIQCWATELGTQENWQL